MKKSRILFGLILLISALVSSITAYADVTATANELVNQLLSRNANSYAPPYARPDGGANILEATGAVVENAVDLHLPGKNGLDFIVKRSYNSQTLDARLSYAGPEARGDCRRTIYPFYVHKGDTTYICYFLFDSERQYIDSKYDIVRLDSFNVGGQYKWKTTDNERIYSPLLLSDSPTGTVVVQRAMDLAVRTVSFYWPIHINTTKGYEYELGYGWELNVPYLEVQESFAHAYCKKCKKSLKSNEFNVHGLRVLEYLAGIIPVAHDNNAYVDENQDGIFDFLNETYIGNSASHYDIESEFTGTFLDDNGSSYVLESSNTLNGNGEMVGTVQFRDNNEYTVLDATPGKPTGHVTHEKAFTYKYQIIHKSGKTYFFSPAGRIRAIADKYGNYIYYTFAGDSIRVVDTYNRQINIEKINDSDWQIKVNDGNDVTMVYYDFEISKNQDDPLDRMVYEDIIKLNVYKNEDKNGEITSSPNKTTYEMTAYDFGSNDSSGTYWQLPVYYYHVNKITYPTGLIRTYNYDVRLKYPIPPKRWATIDYKRVKSYTESSAEGTVTYYYAIMFDNDANAIIGLNEDEIGSRVYTCTVTNSVNNKKTTNTYDKKQRLIKSVAYEGDTLKLTSELAYGGSNRSDPPIQEKLTQQQSASVKPVSIKNYTFDNKSNMLTENDGTYSAVYTYSPDYNMLLTKTYNRDTGKTVKINNVLSDDKKSVMSTETYENDALKTKTEFEYDTYGNISKTTQFPDGVASVVNRFNYAYDSSSGVTVTSTVENVKDNDGVLRDYQAVQRYDFYGNLVSSTDANNNTTSMTYDLIGRLTAQTNPDSTTFGIAYNIAENHITVTNEKHEQTKYLYTPRGQMYKVMFYDTAWRTLEDHTYDGLGRETLFTQYRSSDAASDRFSQSIAYDWADRPVQITYKDKQAQTVAAINAAYTIEADANNRPVTKLSVQQTGDSMIKPAVSEQYFDYRGLLTTDIKKDPANVNNILRTEYTYDIMGNVKTAKSPRYFKESWSTPTVSYDYDYAGNVVRETDANGSSTVLSYDRMGRQTSVTDKKGDITYVAYDNMSRPISVTAPFADAKTSKKLTWYDANNNVVKEKQQSNQQGNTVEEYDTVEYAYDSRNRLTAVKSYPQPAEINYTQYAYDSVGNMMRMYTGLTAPVDTQTVSDLPSGCALTQYEYNPLKQMTRTTDAGGLQQAFTYDYVGNLLGTTDKNGWQISYQYNIFSKPLTETRALGGVTENTSYTYDVAGNLRKVTQGSDIISYGYDNFGRIISESNKGITKNYIPDAEGNITSLSVKNAQGGELLGIGYTYTRLSQYDTLSSGGVTTSYTYDLNGLLTGTSNNTGDSVSYQHNKAGLVTRMENRLNGSLTDFSTYTYYLNGNVHEKYTSVNGKEQGAAYTYDGIGRLAQEEAYNTGENTQFSASYAYDTRGNRTAKTLTDLTTPADSYVTNYTYDIGNKLLKKSQTKGQTSDITDFQYDANGNTIAKLKSTITQGTGMEGFELGKGLGGNELFRYNAYGQLVKYETGGITAQYAYNPIGLRTGKTVNGITTTFVNDRGSVIMEGDASYNIRATYVRGYNLMWSYTADGEKTKYTYNTHGDVVQLADGNGTITKTYGYDAFGNEDNADKNDTNPFRYCGEYFDNESGNIYLRARYYDPATSRMLSEDPARDGTNWYIYCYNNPIKYKDPTGKWGELVHVDATTWIFNELGLDPFHANIVAQANIGVDRGDTAATNQNAAAQGWHFDRNADPNIDSRQAHADEMLNSAIYNWNWADEAYAKGEITVEERHQWRVGALEMIGQGLHALQDIDAHMDIGTNDFNNPISSPHTFNGESPIFQYKNVDNPQFDAEATGQVGVYNRVDTGERFGSQRYRNTVVRSKEYLNSFYSKVNTSQ